MIHPEHSPDESVKTGDNSPVQLTRVNMPKVSWEATTIVSLFVMLVLSVTVNGLNYARNERNDEKLLLAEARATKAEADLKTQVWLYSDSLTKENSALLGRIEAAEDLIQAYGIAKTLRKSKQEK